ncbi:MAG: endonuclease V [Bacteroidota bacterium]
MIYCFDTFYFEDKAQTSCLGINAWSDDEASFELTERIGDIQPYESGFFYKRELPCLKSILRKIELNSIDDILVIDGFVRLDDNKKLGLGGYLFEYLEAKIPVIGVAKNNFATINTLKREITRGESAKPLFITAMGIDLDLASDYISSMHGEFRIPTILKLVDTYCRHI